MTERLEEHKNMGPVEDTSLVDIKDVVINTDMPVVDRVQDYIKQIKNPYCYLDHGIKVRICFSGKRLFEECLKSAVTIDKL